MPSTRQLLRSAIEGGLTDRKGKPVELVLEPGLTASEIDAYVRSLPIPPPEDVRDLLAFCSGVDSPGEPIQGLSFAVYPTEEFLIPRGLVIGGDWCGNHWVVDLPEGASSWGPIYYCCHDAPVMLVQAKTLNQFVDELLKLFTPPHQSLVKDVCDDRLFNVWLQNPGVLSQPAAVASADADLRNFASEFDAAYELIDLRGAPIGMGFSWGRYGPSTEIKRHASHPIFAWKRPEKRGFFSRLFGKP